MTEVKALLKDVYKLKKKIADKYGSSNITNIAEQSLSILEKALLENLMEEIKEELKKELEK